MKRLNILLSTLILAFAAANAHGQAVFGAPPPPATSVSDFNGNGLRIQKAHPTVLDGWDGGLSVTRDMSSMSGGVHGNTNSAITAVTVAGPGETTFEWTSLNVLFNYALYPTENVANYNQGNKLGTGTTWGGVDEAVDVSGKSGGLVGREIDNFVAGLAGPDNVRIGLLLAVGDGRLGRGIPTDYKAEASYAITIGGEDNAPWAHWQNGIWIQKFSNVGIVMDSEATRAMWLRGKYIVAIDTAQAQASTALRAAAGQKVCFDGYDQYCVQEDADSNIVFTNAGTMLMKLTPGGHLYLAGQVHENSR